MMKNLVSVCIENNIVKRIEWVDIGKFICIMFVMLSHLESGTDELRRIYTPFFLTVFFFLSGYTYRKVDSFKDFLYKKIKGLFVPWFVFSHFNILLSQVISLKEKRSLVQCLMWNWLQIRGKDDGMWFVAALFIAYIPFYFFTKLKKPQFAITLSIIFSVFSVVYTIVVPPEVFPWESSNLPWHIEYIFQAMLWMLFGYYFKLYGEHGFDKHNTILLCFSLWTVYLFCIHLFQMCTSIWIHIPLDYVASGIGIVSIISLCKLIKSNRYFLFVGSN